MFKNTRFSLFSAVFLFKLSIIVIDKSLTDDYNENRESEGIRTSVPSPFMYAV